MTEMVHDWVEFSLSERSDISFAALKKFDRAFKALVRLLDSLKKEYMVNTRYSTANTEHREWSDVSDTDEEMEYSRGVVTDLMCDEEMESDACKVIMSCAEGIATAIPNMPNKEEDFECLFEQMRCDSPPTIELITRLEQFVAQMHAHLLETVDGKGFGDADHCGVLRDMCVTLVRLGVDMGAAGVEEWVAEVCDNVLADFEATEFPVIDGECHDMYNDASCVIDIVRHRYTQLLEPVLALNSLEEMFVYINQLSGHICQEMGDLDPKELTNEENYATLALGRDDFRERVLSESMNAMIQEMQLLDNWHRAMEVRLFEEEGDFYDASFQLLHTLVRIAVRTARTLRVECPALVEALEHFTDEE